jgi:hypothetical protein
MTIKKGNLYVAMEIKRLWLVKLVFLVLHKVARMGERKSASWAFKLMSVKAGAVGVRDGDGKQ